MNIQDIESFLEGFAPARLAESWDNVGLLVGDRLAEVRKIMTCLTVTPATVDEAIDGQANLIVTHHPLPFSAVKRLTTDSIVGQVLLKLIAAGVAIYSPHTAFDSAAKGINQRLAEGLGLEDIVPLVPHVDGEGAGRRGRLESPVALGELARRLAGFLRIPNLQAVGDVNQKLSTVAVACGAAGEFLDAARQAKCDAMVLGEARFHTCLEAEAWGIALLLPGHFASERFAVDALAEVLARRFPGLEVWSSREERDPLQWISVRLSAGHCAAVELFKPEGDTMVRALTALPVYNEVNHVSPVLDEVLRYASDVLVVDDGSRDGTGDVLAARSDIKVVTHSQNRGYGAALQSAFEAARKTGFDVLVTIDCDGQHQPCMIPQFVAKSAEADIVSGSRYLKEFAGDSRPPEQRRRINQIITERVNRDLGLRLTDAFCGFKAYSVPCLAKFALTETGYAMPLELWVQAAALGLSIVEMPVRLIYLDESRSFGGALDHAETRLKVYEEVLNRAMAKAAEKPRAVVHRKLQRIQ